MAGSIEFWFDFSSPYGYLAAHKIEALAAKHGRAVDWHPMLLGAAFKQSGMAPLTQIPLKGDYSKRDFQRSARFHGVADFRMPANFPIPSQAAARIVLWTKARDPALAVKVIKALYRAYFFDGLDISNPDVAADVAAMRGRRPRRRARRRRRSGDQGRAEARGRRRDRPRRVRLAVRVRRWRAVLGSRSLRPDRPLARLPGASDVSHPVALSHVRYLVSEFEPLLRFYRDVLGLKVAVDVPGVYVELDSAGGRLAFYRADLMAGVVGGTVATRAGDDIVICLRVDNVDAAANRVKLAGMTLVTAPHDQAAWLQRVAHLRDPAGHFVELWSPLPPPPQSA